MKAYGVITFILLGLCIQASSTANTTQPYYFELHIESSAFDRFTRLLGNITDLIVSNGKAKITDITLTTDCQFSSCTCFPNYSWSEIMCKMHPECCQSNICPTNAMCLHKNKVNVNGSFTIQHGKLSEELEKKLTMSIISIYSSMKWFDLLQISFRTGSIIGDFVLLVNGPFDMDLFMNLTKVLQNTLNATLNIITTGFIKIQAPGMIGYNTNANITCTTPVSTLNDVKWYIQKDSKQRITNGTEVTVSQDSLTSTVSVNQTSEVWKGTFICDYMSKMFSGIIHRASVFLDIALLPHILITSEQQFPNCKDQTRTFEVSVNCIIDNSTETYSVTWLPNNYETTPISEGKTTIYINKIRINCAEEHEDYKVSCIFKNRANNTKDAILIMPVIYATSLFCQAIDEWQTARANFTVKMQCNPNEVGFKSRECTSLGTWGPINSYCVNDDIWNLLTEAQKLQKGCGLVEENAKDLFGLLKNKTENQLINTFSNINASVGVLDTLNNASETQKPKFTDPSIVTNFLKSSSNLLNNSLLDYWKSPVSESQSNLAVQYLRAVEGVVNRIDMIMEKPQRETNVELMICNMSVDTCKTTFNVTFDMKTKGTVYQAKINNLFNLLPQLNLTKNVGQYVLSVTYEKTDLHKQNLDIISMQFPNNRAPNHRIICVFFNFTTNEWSGKGCKWGGASKPNDCTCNHLSAFTTIMSANPVELVYMTEITFTGLGFSICSLILCLAIEFVVWDSVVKSSIAHFRHTVLVNIAFSLLIAHCSFIASSSQNVGLKQWCLAFTVMKHFFFLAVFFWMLCMSLGLLHQMIYVFVPLRKKVYLGLCFFLGYICPLFIVICTVITYDNGAPDFYYIKATCWLKYDRMLQGSIHSFVIPVGIIVLVNMFTMVVVISRILKPTLSEGKNHDEKEIVRSVIRTVVLLTPSLGITWIFGFCIPMFDLTEEPLAQIINYAFTLFNSFQGFFILLTGCLGEKKVRDALLMRIQSQRSPQYTQNSSMTKMAAVKKK